MELTTILMRTLFTYFFLLLIMRMLGKRELAKMSVFDVVISILLAEMAVLAIEEVKKPALYYYLPMLLIALLEIGFSYLFLKSKKFRDLLDGTADMIIENGEIREEAMKKNRMNYDDLIIQLRQKNVNNLADVEFAILEPTGELSVFPKKEESGKNSSGEEPIDTLPFYQGLPVPLIVDGVVREDGLKKIGRNQFWLHSEIRKRGIRHFKDVSFCSVDEKGVLYVDKKDKPRRGH